MSRRSRVTIEVLVRMPLPAGAKPAQALAYVRAAIGSHAGGLDPHNPMFDLAPTGFTIQIVKRETTYL